MIRLPPHLLLLTALCLSCLWGVRPAGAQTVQVQLRSEGAALPPGGALVLALDSTGTVAASGVTRNGSARLDLPRPGSWTIRAEHLGFATADTAVVIDAGTPTMLTLTLGVDPVAVRGIDVTTESLCGEKSADPAVPRLWREARAILNSAASEERPRPVRFRVATTTLQIETGAHYLHLRGELEPGFNQKLPQGDTTWVAGPRPFPPADPDRLLTEGFILPSVPGGEELYLYDYHAPHPTVILSDAFLASHCFWVERDEEHEGMVGLAFGPNELELLEHDVEGVLWLPDTADAWPWIDFRYTRLPEEGRLRDRGGQGCWYGVCYNRRGLWDVYYPQAVIDERFDSRIDLARVEGVGWIVSRLVVRAPVARRQLRRALTSEAEWKINNPEQLERRDIQGQELLVMWYVMDQTREVLEVQVGEGGG